MLVQLALAGACLSACGAANSTAPAIQSRTLSADSAQATATATSTRVHLGGSYLHADGDKDGDEGSGSPDRGQDEQSLLAGYRRAGPRQARAIAALVSDYYAATLAGNGSRACRLLSATQQAGVGGEGPSSGRSSCAAAMTSLLTQQHAHLASEDPATMVVVAVYTHGDEALAVVGFRTAPESELLLVSEHGGWRVDELFDSEMP